MDEAYVPRRQELRVGAILTMTRDGTIFSSSPELASLPPDQTDRWSLGNVLTIGSLDELLASERAVALQREIDAGVALCRETCEYFGVCGGGSPGNKLYERGTFAVSETLKCALQTKALTDVILENAAAADVTALA